MFMKDGVELPCPDSAAGLYIKTRTDQIVKVWNSSNAREPMMTNVYHCLFQISITFILGVVAFLLFEIILINIAGWHVSSLDLSKM